MEAYLDGLSRPLIRPDDPAWVLRDDVERRIQSDSSEEYLVDARLEEHWEIHPPAPQDLMEIPGDPMREERTLNR